MSDVQHLFLVETYHKSIQAFFHAHIISFLEIAEVDLVDVVVKIMVGELIKPRRHDDGIDSEGRD